MNWPNRSPDDDPWRVARTDFPGGRELSTVFLGIDHNLIGEGPPVLFETMLFGSTDGSEEQWRWTTWDQAAAGHAAIVADLTDGIRWPISRSSRRTG